MKKVTLIPIILLIVFLKISIAQVGNGTFINNWTFTDVDGIEHTLYDYLDDGKKVVLSLVAANDQIGAMYVFDFNDLPALYETYGPEGTDEVMVFMIEADPATTDDDINGIGENTVMNWNSALDFPIINTSELNDVFGYDGTTVTMLICENRRTANLGASSVALTVVAMDDCPSPEYETNANMSYISEPQTMYCDNFITPQIVIENLGSTEITSLEIETKVDNEVVQSYNWTGSINTWYRYDMVLPVISDIEDGNHEVEISILTVNSAADENTDDNSMSGAFSVYDNGNPVWVEVLTDDSPIEIAWTIKIEDSVVWKKDDYTLHQTLHNDIVCLDLDTYYTIEVTDDWGDGFENLLVGHLYVMFDDDTLVNISGDSFTSSIVDTFYVRLKSAENDFLSFSLLQQIGDAVIDSENNTVHISVLEATDIRALRPDFELSEYAKAYIDEVAQESGVTINDFSSDVIYTVVAENGNEANWTVSVSNAVSISENNLNNIHIYPNPANDVLFISNALNTNIIIYDILGSKVLENAINNGQVNISKLKSGYYFIQLESDDKQIIKEVKIIKK